MAVDVNDLPPDVRREFEKSGRLPKSSRRKSSPSKATAWKDVPSGDGWRVCRPHGLAWRGPYPCVYCESEGAGNVQGNASIDA